MPTYEVIVTRTKVEIASFTLSAKTAEDAEAKVKSKLEPEFDSQSSPEQIERMEKAARRAFDNNPADTADNTTEFEYEVEEA